MQGPGKENIDARHSIFLSGPQYVEKYALNRITEIHLMSVQ